MRSAKGREAGKKSTVTMLKKPLGLALADNPGGRGVSVTDLDPDGTAAKRGGIVEGDYIVSLSWGTRTVDCTWLKLEEVQAAIEESTVPLKIQLSRGGPEPWMSQRDGGGLSVDEMVDVANEEYGRVMTPAQVEPTGHNNSCSHTCTRHSARNYFPMSSSD